MADDKLKRYQVAVEMMIQAFGEMTAALKLQSELLKDLKNHSDKVENAYKQSWEQLNSLLTNLNAHARLPDK